jgi:lycopene beta-cyclase
MKQHECRVSPLNLVPTGDRKEFRHIILGAGCAGLSLAWYLLEAGVTEPILLLDQRQEYTNDRTWCYWGVEPTPFDDLAEYSWNAWDVILDQHQRANNHSTRYPYLFLRSGQFYRRVLDRLQSAYNVTLRLGQKVQGYEEVGGKVVIHTAEGSYTCQQLFNSVGVPSSNLSRASKAQPWLQHFHGKWVQANRPVFDSKRITLMDHHVSQKDGPHFMYVLPFSSTEALVENTYLFPTEVSPARHHNEIADYLARNYHLKSWDYEVLEEEAGAIPMGRNKTPKLHSERIQSIGVAGGAVRPSTGYAFMRIQRQCRQIAARVASGQRITENTLRFSPRKYDLFDEIMLRALSQSPHLAPTFFMTLFQHAPTDSVVRFLSECSSFLDEVKIVRALLKPELIRMILKLVWDRQVTLAPPLTTPQFPKALQR